MNTEHLPDKITLKKAIEELDLYKASEISALNTLLYFTTQLKTPIWFNHDIDGYEVGKPLDEITDDHNEITGVMPCEEVSFFKNETSLIATTGNCFWENGHFISVSSFRHNNINYNTVEETQQWLESQAFRIECFYIKKEDFLTLFNKLQNDNNEKTSKSTRAISNANSDSVLKALALIAKEYAEDNHSYRKGNQVNSSAFRRHLLKLAVKYNVSTNGLKKIDDKINPMLEDLDINELLNNP